MPRAPATDKEIKAMRRRMVQGGLELYRDKGLVGVSFRRMAEALGISHTLPYRYFEDKDALLAAMRCAAVREFGDYLRVHCPAGLRVEARIRAIASAYVAYGRRHTADYLLIFSSEQPPPTRYPALLAARRAVFDYALEPVQAGVESGVFAGDARNLAHLFWVSLHGLMTLYAANQLVHGNTLDELVTPIIEALQRAASAGTQNLNEMPT